MMRIQQLQYLEKIVESGSINEAAKALFLSQPSLSNAIKELEQEMDLQLLVRQNSGPSQAHGSQIQATHRPQAGLLSVRPALCLRGPCLCGLD